MLKRNLILIAAAMTATAAMADQRPESEARRAAQQYVSARRGATAASHLTLVADTQLRRNAHRAPQLSTADATLSTPYYVYNSPEGGFVVVSGTTALSPVIASSDTGTIDPDGPMPDGLRYWLGYAAAAAAYADQHPEAAASHPAEARRHAPAPGIAYAEGIDYRKDIKPLLVNSPIGNIQWGQDAPYNDQCPTRGGRHCYVGCMATAMAQVLVYHQHPMSYDWSDILPAYKGVQSTSAQRSEAARLSHEVGQALHMEYGTDQSGSVSTQYTVPLAGEFGFNRNVALLNRDDFTYGEWMDILLSELMQNRPVIYDGISSAGGHAFVIDGYRAKDGFVHVNWGWEGLSDGYYNIVLLDPKETGIGAILADGFTQYQDMVVGIEPNRQKDINYYLPIQGYAGTGELVIGTGTADLDQGDRRGYISFSNILNMKSEAFSGEYGALFVDQDGQIVGRAKAGTVSAAASSMASNADANPTGGYYEIPDLPVGTYRVYCYVEDNKTGQWAILRTAVDHPNFCTMTIAGGKAHFSIAQHQPTGLQATKWSFETSAPKYGATGLTVTITNTGDEVEYGSYAFSVDVPNEISRNYYDEFHRLLPGESETVTFPVTFTQYGEYTVRRLELYRLNGGGSATIVEPGTITFNVNRSNAEMTVQLNNRITEVQRILDRARLSGNYTTAACDALQAAIDAARTTDTTSADAINAALKALDTALAAFYRTLADSDDKVYKGYVSGQDHDVNSSWCPGGTAPGYFGISLNEEDLSAYVGGQIIGLRCLFGQKNQWYTFSGDDMKVKCFLLPYDGAYPGSTILASGPTHSPTHYATYDEYLFDMPYTIGAGGVLCVAEVCTPKSGGMFGAMGSSKSVVGPGTCWMNNGGGWEDMYYNYGSSAYGLAIQAIIVGGGNVTDAKLSNAKAKSVMVGEDITVNAKVQNLCQQDINKITVAWSTDEGTSGTQTISRRLAPNASADITVTVPGLVNAKLHSITLDVTGIDDAYDQIPDNSTVTIQVPVTAHKYTRRVVCEENTGLYCGFCPRGIATFEYMKEKYPDTFIPVSIHHFTTPDDMQYTGSNYDPIFLYLGSAPSGIINRSEKAFTNMNKGETEDLYLSESETCIAQIEAQAYYDAATRTVAVATQTEFGYDYAGADYRISYLVLEDHLGPFMQNNYYAGGAIGKMEGWENKPSSAAVMCDDVLREQIDSYFGTPGTLPQSGKGGQTINGSYDFPLPASVKNPDNVRIVTLIIDRDTREIINAAQSRLTKGIPEGIDSVLAPSALPTAPYDLSGRRTTTTSGLRIESAKKVLR